MLRNVPIRRKLMTAMLLTSGSVLLLTCSAYFAYELVTYRQTAMRELSTLGQIMAANSTAALAFDSRADATEILSAVKAERSVVVACLFDEKGILFSKYPDDALVDSVTTPLLVRDYHFEENHLVGYQPVLQGDKQLGVLFLKSNMDGMHERLQLYVAIALMVVALSSIVAYVLAKYLQKGISEPILILADTAKIISTRNDYSVRVQTKISDDEVGLLTQAFNQMLVQIEAQNLEITTFNQKLEQIVQDRTQEMQQANKELEAFSYSVSHDLRAPLRSIHGYMNIFSEEYFEKLDDEGKRLVTVILRNSQKMGQLIDDLLAFSQLGRKELVKSNVLMKDLVSSIWEEQLRMEKKRKIHFKLHALPEVLADSVTIKQVWINLISNALKYTSHQESSDIEIGYEDRPNEVMFYVKDNGAGFDMQYYDKLFGVFQRLHSLSEFDGTGVGLAIVQRIIAKHGGKVWAEGKPNAGATFFFSLKKQ